MDLYEIQTEHTEWITRNFPNQTIEQAVMGMIEEMGELCHALLKSQQGIRGMDEDTALAKIIDAHCDLIIFSLFIAEKLGYDLGENLTATWEQVRQRNWVENPAGDGY